MGQGSAGSHRRGRCGGDGRGAGTRVLHVDALVGGAIKTGEPSVLLSPAQAEALWQQTIETDPARPGLLQPAAAARQALDAHDLCRAWRIDRKALWPRWVPPPEMRQRQPELPVGELVTLLMSPGVTASARM
jgi:hypothetical protein